MQAVARYFVLDDDAEQDRESPFGFLDDEEVVVAVEAALQATVDATDR